MQEELVSLTATFLEKGVEISAELLRMLASAAPKMFSNALDVTRTLEDKTQSMARSGNISHKNLLKEAIKAKSATLSTDNFAAADMAEIEKKAKKSGIPLSVIGNGDKRSLEFLERDKAIVNQIVQDLMQERLKEAPQNIKSFSVSPGNIATVKEQFEKNGIECQFAQSANGKVYCMYPAAYAEKAAAVKSDIQALQASVSEDFKAERKNGIAIMEDTKLGKSISFVNENNRPLTKSQVMQTLQEQFGYSNVQADLAANKLCDDLQLDNKAYLSHNAQLEQINALKTNIKFENDSILLSGNTFSAVNFKGGTGTHIFITNGDKGAALTPGSMTETEMKNICITSLNMSEQQADEAVKKSLKIDSQINSKLKETTIYREGGSQTVNINRTSHSSFSVMVGKTKRMYDFNDKDLAAKMCKDFGITEGKAQNIIDKAKKQGTIGNKVHDGLKKAADTIKPKTSEIGKIGKGVKR